MKKHLFSKNKVRVISLILIICVLVSGMAFPMPISAEVSYSEPTDLSEGLLLNVDDQEILAHSDILIDGTKISSSTAPIELQREQRVAGWNWSIKKENNNSVIRACKLDHKAWYTGGALRLNYDGQFCILKPAQAYYVSFKYKVVSAQKTFYNSADGITYPLDTQRSYFRFGFGANVSGYLNNGNGMPNVTTTIATVAEISNNATQFYSYNEYGEVSVKNVGEWYTAEFYFSTPENLDYIAYLAFSTALYNGVDIYLDDIYVKETPTVTLRTNGGKGINVKHPALVGEAVDFPTPTREGYSFAGWYKDIYCTTPFTDTVFTEENCNLTLYAKWERELSTFTADFFDYETGSAEDGTYKQNVSLTQNNSTDNVAITGIADAFGTKVLTVSSLNNVNAAKRAYIPLGNINGNIRVKSNTTYSLLVDRNYSLSDSSSYTIKFFAANSENVEGTETSIASFKTSNSVSERQYFTFTTGEIPSGNDALYLEIAESTQKNNVLAINKVKLVEIGSDINYIRAYDKLNNTVYEYVGHYGDSVSLEALKDTANYTFDGWYLGEDFAKKHNGVHKNESITYLYALWQNKVVDFENFVAPTTDSYHTIGDDITIGQFAESYGGKSMLKYSYNSAPNYFNGSHNAASLAVVYDKTTYKVTFKYKLDTSIDDVQLKFFTAHRSNRWSYITNYDEATYTIRFNEAGEGWKEGTVYLTTEFVKAEHSDGLFMSFNPIVEGKTVVCIDDFKVDVVKADKGVVAFLGKDNVGFDYTIVNVGATVNALSTQPSAYFTAFDGWYTDKELTTPFTSASVTKGITYVYSKWVENTENFEGYVYENSAIVNDNNNTVLKNGKAVLGRVENNATYLVTYKYKTNDTNASVWFETADKDYGNAVAYNEEGNILEANEIVVDNNWHTVKRYISVFANDNANMLCVNADNASVDDIVVRKVDVLSDAGSSVLTSESETAVNSQAIRFFYAYKSENGAIINLDGQELTLVERGIVLKSANNENGILTLSHAQSQNKGYVVLKKTYGFGTYWNYDSDNGSVVYSYYLTDLYKDDIRNISARGYIKVKDSKGAVYTIYSSEKDTTVKAVKAVAAEVTDKKVHTLAGYNWNRFTIVNPKVMPYIYGMQIENLIEFAAERGVTLNRVNEKEKATPYEIVIGDTKRDTSALVNVNGENEWVIAVRGTKVIIKGGSDIATAEGVIQFMNHLTRKEELNCGADLYDGITIRGEYKAKSDAYALAFNDDFETFDTSVWTVYAGQGQGLRYEDSILGGTCTLRGYGNDPVTTISGESKELVRVENGNLVLGTAYGTPTYQKDIDMNAQFFNSNVSSFGRMIYQYGMLEIREKVAAQPACSSLWVNGDGTFNGEKRGCMTEYDLNENYGFYNHVESCIHHWSNNHTTGKQEHFGPNSADYTGSLLNNYKPDIDENSLYEDYHIYTFVWEEDKIIFAFDGVKYCEYSIPDWYKENACNNLILSCGMGSRSYGADYDPEKHADYLESYIDYVRIYQVEDMGSKLYYK